MVVLNWNAAGRTLRCAESVLAGIRGAGDIGRFSLVLVDNGSEAESVAALEAWVAEPRAEPVRLVLNALNLGFAAGMNAGIRGALVSGPVDYFWLLNNDLEVESDALASLVQAVAKQPGVKVWGPTVLDQASGLVQCAGGCRYLAWLGLDRPAYAGLSLDCVPERPDPKFDYIYGAAMLVAADLLETRGGLDESYFLYFEELELARRAGGPDHLGWCREAVVRHSGSKSSGGDRRLRAFSAYHAALSAFRYTGRYHPWFLPTVILGRTLGLLIKGAPEGSLALAAAPWRALADFLRRRCRREPI